MDMKETSAMTEASGLTNDDGGIEQASQRGRAARRMRAVARRIRMMPRCAGPNSCAR